MSLRGANLPTHWQWGSTWQCTYQSLPLNAIRWMNKIHREHETEQLEWNEPSRRSKSACWVDQVVRPNLHFIKITCVHKGPLMLVYDHVGTVVVARMYKGGRCIHSFLVLSKTSHTIFKIGCTLPSLSHKQTKILTLYEIQFTCVGFKCDC